MGTVIYGVGTRRTFINGDKFDLRSDNVIVLHMNTSVGKYENNIYIDSGMMRDSSKRKKELRNSTESIEVNKDSAYNGEKGFGLFG